MLDLSGNIICITQPEHMPWLGYLDKLYHSDYLILLDNVQYKKRHFENRNKIRVDNENKFLWLTVPVITKGRFTQKISEVEIDYSTNWTDKYLKTIEHIYNKSTYFHVYFELLSNIYFKRHIYLVDLNIDIIQFMKESFDLNTKLLRASAISSEGRSSNLILNILLSINATYYFSGKHGGLDEELLKASNIKIILQQFEHPRYNQLTSDFLSGMSFVDLLFNYGPESLNTIYNIDGKKSEKV
jgi:hypothetical protein